MHSKAQLTPRRNNWLHSDAAALILLSLLWFLIEWMIDPVGEFPLNDDWSYIRSLQHLYQDHSFHLEGWTSMPLIGQLVWGLLFCKIFGFSFTALRCSTLVLGLAGIIAAWLLTREFTRDKRLAFLSAAILMLNPLYVNLANTFMTDIPFTSLLLLAILLFVRALKYDSIGYLIAGLVVLIASIMIRQLGLLAAGAFALAWIAKGGLKVKPILIAFIVTLVPLAIYMAYNYWLKTTGNYPSKYDEGFKRVLFALFSPSHSAARLLLRQALTILVYTGLFISPLLVLFEWKRIWRRWQPLALGIGAIMTLAAIFALTYKPVLPTLGNIIHPFGLGPASLRDTALFRYINLLPLPSLVWSIATIAGILGGASIMLMLGINATCIWKSSKTQDQPSPFALNGISLPFLKWQPPSLHPAVFFLISFAGLYLIIVLVGGVYDRYLLPLIPILTILLIVRFTKKTRMPLRKLLLTGLLLLPFAFFSIAGTADYMSWNRARWNALDYLTHSLRIPPQQIDGGFEFNGYTQYSDADINSIKEKADPAQPSWWWVSDDKYIISFGPLPGYRTIKTFSYQRHLGPSAPNGNDIHVLLRSE